MPDSTDGGLLQSLQGPPQGFGAELGAGLQSLAAGYQGLPDPQAAQFKQQLELIKLQQTIQARRLEKSKVLLSIARDLPDDNPDAMRKKLEIYQQSGFVTFTPGEMDRLITSEQAKKIPGRLGAVIGALDQGMDPATLPQSLTAGIDVQMLKSLPKGVRQQIDPEGRKRLADALTADLGAERARIDTARKQRLESGHASPLDLIAEGAKTPEDLGGRLVAHALATGTPIAPEHRPLVEAYRRQQDAAGATKEVLAIRAAQGDPTAQKALEILRQSEEGKKLVGEAPRPFLNATGNAAPGELTQKAAIRQGYFLADAREAQTVSQYPRAMQLLNNIAETLREVRDLGGFRTKTGAVGAYQRFVGIPMQRAVGDPQGLGGKLSLLAGQQGELIQVFRALDERGNIAAKIMIPQLQAVSPEAGMVSSFEMLKKIEAQLRAGIKQTRVSGMADTAPGLPLPLHATSREYQQLRAKGWTDQAIETGQGAPDGQPLTINGRPVLVIK